MKFGNFPVFSIILFLCCDEIPKGIDARLSIRHDSIFSDWNHALPIGNGLIGAMIYGTANELLNLNDPTLFSGPPDDYEANPIKDKLPLMLELLKAGKAEEVEKLIDQNHLGRQFQAYQPLANLTVDFGHQPDQISNYRKILNLDSSYSSISYLLNGVDFKRSYAASYPDDVIILSYTASEKKALKFDLNLSSPHPSKCSAEDGIYYIVGKGPSMVMRRSMEELEKFGDQHKYPKLFNADGSRKYGEKQVIYDSTDGVGFVAAIAILDYDGDLTIDQDGIHFRNGSQINLILTTETAYNGFQKPLNTDYVDRAKAHLKSKQLKPVRNILTRHYQDYRSLFDRVSLDIESDISLSSRSTDERIRTYYQDEDPAMVNLLFQYGRYLLISSSRAGGQPANLQGIWNKDLIPNWNSQHTLNINSEMNYWAANSTRIPEVNVPFHEFIKDLSDNGKLTSQNYYGNAGWVVHHNTDLWRSTHLLDKSARFSFWPMGSGWLSNQLFDHFQYELDTTFLAEAYPIMLGASEFYLDWLVEDETGKLITPISTSPENSYYNRAGKVVAVTQKSAMDIGIIRELFNNTILASKILDKEAQAAPIQRSLEQLADYTISEEGVLLEWDQDYKEVDPQHRHLSHLYGMFPGHKYSPFINETLSDAAEKSLLIRGDEGMSWSVVWKMALWARLLNSDKCLELLSKLILPPYQQNFSGIYPNLFSGAPMQIDANLGIIAAITEMLVQSHDSVIHVLPALPKAWTKGKLEGIKARGGFLLDIQWENATLKSCKITSLYGQSCTIRTDRELSMVSDEIISYRQLTVRNKTYHEYQIKLKRGEEKTINVLQ